MLSLVAEHAENGNLSTPKVGIENLAAAETFWVGLSILKTLYKKGKQMHVLKIKWIIS